MPLLTHSWRQPPSMMANLVIGAQLSGVARQVLSCLLSHLPSIVVLLVRWISKIVFEQGPLLPFWICLCTAMAVVKNLPSTMSIPARIEEISSPIMMKFNGLQTECHTSRTPNPCWLLYKNNVWYLCQGLWTNGQDAILDIRVTNTDQASYIARDPESVFQFVQKEKMKKYLCACQHQRHAFTPFVISVDDLLRMEAKNVLKQLACRLAEKWNKPYLSTRWWWWWWWWYGHRYWWGYPKRRKRNSTSTNTTNNDYKFNTQVRTTLLQASRLIPTRRIQIWIQIQI